MFFLFKQKTAYEMLRSLVGSEMCIRDRSYSVVFSDKNYEALICGARTFGFLQEVEFLQAKGLGLGGSLDNVIILDDEKVINKDGLRMPDEFVRHKILDAIGDLFLLGMPIICLLYTSDAADDLLCVDLGGRRITKKKKHNTTNNYL